jgi:propanol-preferring alcohol dehydrogenase
MSTYQAFQTVGGGRFELVERELVEPLPGQVRLRVQYCGVCHTDAFSVEPPRAAPVVPGHEIAGVIDALGAGVDGWQVGQRVGVGYLGGHCNRCVWCRRGDFVLCENQSQVGSSQDGGYAEIAYARASGLVGIPDGVDAIDAAPLLCAGITVFKPLRGLGLEVDAVVGVQGIGGLGHLALQYANRLGYRVVAIARGAEKAELATKLGAQHYIDTTADDPAEALQQLGGAQAIIATASSGGSMSALIAGLAPRGTLVVVGAAGDPIQVGTADLIFGERSIRGSLTGTPIDNEDNLAFSAAHVVAPMVEVMPFAETPAAYQRMMSGRARFRVVLDLATAS